MSEQLEKIATGIAGVVEKQTTFEASLKSIQEENANLKSELEAKNKDITELKSNVETIDAKMKKSARFGSFENSYNNEFTEQDSSALKQFFSNALNCKTVNDAELKSKLNLQDSKNNTVIAYNKITKSFRTDIGVDGGNVIMPRTITAPRVVDMYKLTYAPMLELCNRVVSTTVGITTPIISLSAIIAANFKSRPELTSSQEGNTLQFAAQDISTYEMAVHYYVSTKMLTQINEGTVSIDLLAQQLTFLEQVKAMKKNKLILNGTGQQEANGIITEAKKSGGRISKIQTKVSNAIDLNDLLSAVTDFENFVDYYINPNFAIMIDKSTFGLITRQEALDGHYKFNNMTVHIEGIGSNSILLRVGTYTIRVMSVDHNAGLDSFTEGGSNAGKIVAVIGDFKNGYTYLDSTQNVFLDGTNLVTEHIKGSVPFYNSTYFGGDITDNKALKVLQIKA